jgi:hypothetical protein
MVTVSNDGGATFGAPRNIGIFQTGELQVAGGPAGTAYLVGLGMGGMVFVRTEDGGATWSPPQSLGGDGGNLRLAAAGKRVVISGSTGQGATLWRSEDGGRTFR